MLAKVRVCSRSYDKESIVIKSTITIIFMLFLMALLGGCSNTKKDTPEGDISPMVMFEDKVYVILPKTYKGDTSTLTEAGKIESVIDSSKEPTENNQANDHIDGAIIYKDYSNNIVIEYNGNYWLYKERK